MKNCCRIFVPLLLGCWALLSVAQTPNENAAGIVQTKRNIPDDNLGYPVLINLTDCSSNIAAITASGFYLNTGPEQYLVTARHVLFNEAQRVQPGESRPLQCNTATLVSYSKNPKETEQNELRLDLKSLNATGAVKGHSTRDVAVVHIGNNNPSDRRMAAVPGVQAIKVAPSGFLLVGVEIVQKLEDVLTANDVYVLGYPSSIGIQQAPQIDYSTPLLRKGIVAGINRSSGTIVLDCLVFQGNSGGPVLQVTHQGFTAHFTVIGVVSQYVPFAETWLNTTLRYANIQVHNSGYSIAEPMDAVLELVGK